MPHLALYRRLRPKDFSEIVGQEHVVRIIKNQLLANTVGHAYLFCGTRGTGKTSMAKILAKALNCTAITPDGPCGVCGSCTAANENRNLNIIEIDAASNNGVDNIREIREEVKYPPQDGGVKVYIVDEVHMLSTGAFNALLKTLEEPPPRVVFILATTDAQRIPATILSRCVRLDFRRISVGEMSAALKEFTDEEKISVSENALRYICSISDGAMRDALSLLDQCISYYPAEEIDTQKVMAITGAVDSTVFFELMEALYAFDSAKSLDVIEEMVDLGRDVGRFVSDFIQHLRNLLVVPYMSEALDMSEADREKYITQGKKVGSSRLMSYIHEFGVLSASLRYFFNDRILLECLCIKLCNPESSEREDLTAVLARLEKLEAGVSTVRRTERTVELPSEKAMERAGNTEAEAARTVELNIDQIISGWESFKRSFPPPMNVFLEGTKADFMGEVLCIIFADDSWITHVNERKDMISEEIEKKYGRKVPLVLMPAAEHKGAEGEKAGYKNNGSIKPDPKEPGTTTVTGLGGIEIEWE